MSDFPRWMHHPDKGSRLCRDEAALEQLGEGWFESPADFGFISCPAKGQESWEEPVEKPKRKYTRKG